MNAMPSLEEDHHVHSTFSVGMSTLKENIAHAERVGLRHLGCVDNVRTDTTYHPDLAAAVHALRPATAVRLSVGIEASILDTKGLLDCPTHGLDRIDLIYVADHEFPWSDGPHPAGEIKQWLRDGKVSSDTCIATLVEATIAAIRVNRSHPLVLAHLFSILPKVGLSESQVPTRFIDELAAVAARTGTVVEISEKWCCPSARTLRAVRLAGGTVVSSTDSHMAMTIGRYGYVRSVLQALAT